MIAVDKYIGLMLTIMLLSSGCFSRPSSLQAFDIQKRTAARERVVFRAIGEAGQSFGGYLLIDGDKRSVSGVTPAEFSLTACVVIGHLYKVRGDGKLSFEIEQADGKSGFGQLVKPRSSVNFGYHDGTLKAHF